MDFKNAKELLALCQKKKLPISEVMRQREILLGETTAEIVDQRMDRVLEIMKDAAFSPIKDPVISMGGLIGGEARKLCEFHDLGKSLCGNVLGKGITYAMATLETNASMGLIVASPTAGSAAKKFHSSRSSHCGSDSDLSLTSANSTGNCGVSHGKIADRACIK